MKYLDLYAYFDYRQFLGEYYARRKSLDSKFSYRWFAGRAGIRSVGLYQSLVKGKVNLSDKARVGFAKAMGMNNREEEYFELMVNFTHALTLKAREEIFEEMVRYLPLVKRRVAANQKEYYSRWYIVAVHQALSVLNFRDDYVSLSRFLNPPLKIQEARRAIKVLRELELIVEDEQGFLRPTENTVIGSGKEVGAFAIRKFQNVMMDMAIEAQDRIPASDRNFWTSTLSISQKGRRRIQQRLSEMHQEIMQMVASDSGAEQVCQINLQFFPLSTVHYGAGEKIT